jgi:14-3-3 protein epsilon
MSEKYEKQVYLAMLAEQCNRFEDMMNFLDEMVRNKTEALSSDERNLLSIAYKNTISLRRTAIRTLSAYEGKERKKDDSAYLSYIVEYKKRVETELEKLCEKIISSIDQYLLPKSSDAESSVFYHKMKADYFRYVAESIDESRKKTFADQSLNSYNEAMKTANTLDVINPIRLGLALNFSVFYYEVIGDKEKACNIAKETLSGANDQLSKLDERGENEDEESDYKDSISIANLLQENLSMWTNETDQ